MNTEQNNPKIGRPKVFSDPVDISVRMEREMYDWLKMMYPISVSRGVVAIIDSKRDEMRGMVGK